MYALLLDNSGRVLSVMDPRYRTEDTPLVTSYPEGCIFEYRYVNGKWIHDPVPQERDEGNAHDVLDSLLLGNTPMNRLQAAEQLRRALQMFAGGLTEEQALEVVAVYDPWTAGKAYKAGEFLVFGTNGVGDPQLYKVNQAHTSQADWQPDAQPTLYTAIGLDAYGYPMWSQPTGAHDAYNIGDVVNYNGTLYESKIDGNTTVPGTDDRYWALHKK